VNANWAPPSPEGFSRPIVVRYDWLMASKHPVERGQRYRDLSSSRFGVLGTEWIVDAIFKGTDGIRYAHLVNASDLTQHKTLALDVLGDRNRFERV
jgi:hypothetical protein